MTQFFWSAGHIGWAFFALLVFTGVWWLVADLAWRQVVASGRSLALVFGGCWFLGVALILIGAWRAGWL